ncbi:MAG: hypothetical protein ACOC9J_05255 [Persicimonas sp.]
MSEEEKSTEESAEQSEQEVRESGGQKIMCFVSKQMVPINQTVELQYMPGKKVRVMPKYVKYDAEEDIL